jgi:hypothetical protein
MRQQILRVERPIGVRHQVDRSVVIRVIGGLYQRLGAFQKPA